MIEHPFLPPAFLVTSAPSCAQASFLGAEVGSGYQGVLEWEGGIISFCDFIHGY